MGLKCKHCGTDNGVTMFEGKTCKRCGKELGCTCTPFPTNKNEVSKSG